METLTTVLIASASLAPLTQSPQEIATAIEASYNSRIESEYLRRGRSLFGCVVEQIKILGQDPITLQQRVIDVSVYRARKSDKEQKAVIILPPTGGVNILDRGYANELCSAGITTALISGWDHQNEVSLDFNMHNNGALRMLSATRNVVEFLAQENHQSIGILGTSVGAIGSTLIMQFESRISTAALIVGSARFADVIVDSDEAGTLSLRKKRMAIWGLKDDSDYRKAVREAVFIEPSKFMARLKNKKALVVSADADTTVSSAYQYELADAINANPHLQLKGNHLQVIKQTFFSHRSKIVDFFLKNLSDDDLTLENTF